jgi:hypothetical protein
MDYGTAKTEVRARLQELAPDFWTDSEVLRAMNEGLTRFSLEEKWTWLLAERTGVNLAANTPTLDLEAGVNFERHFNLMMEFTGDSRPRLPRRVSAVEGYQLRTRFYNTASEPMYYYIAYDATGESVVPTVRFVPVLNRAATVSYQYIRDPVPLTGADAQVIDCPDEYVMAVVAYATGHLFLKELSTSAKADEQFALYQKIVNDARRLHKKLIPDSGFAWGRNEPEFGAAVIDDDFYAQLVTPPTFGP